MSLSSDKIQAIRERVDIVRIIGAYVALKKKGRRYVGLCPFHAEKTPSFSVSASKGLYYCFGCHAGGDVFSFLMRHQGLDFQTAARQLARDAGIELVPESEAEKKRRKMLEEIARVNDYAQAYFEHALLQAGAQPARDYLEARGVPLAFARQRHLGFGGAPGELLAYLQAKNVSPAAAARAGLLSEDGRRCLFAGRLTFAVFDQAGRLAGFSARRVGDGAGPKYVNTRESPLFAKRRLLFAWRVAQDPIRRSSRVIIVEGQMDVLACQRAGLSEAVAPCGTALTDEHARMCARLAKEAVILFDGDTAGQAASREAAARLLGAKLKTLIAPIDAGQDPDDLMREEGPAALKSTIDRAIPAVEHFIESSFAEAKLSIEDRAESARLLAPLLMALPSGLERDLYTARLAEKVGISVEQLRAHLQTSPKPVSRPETPCERQSSATKRELPDRFELNVLGELLLYPELRGRMGELAEYASDLMRLTFEELAGSDEPIADILTRHIPDPRIVARLAQVRPIDGEPPEERDARADRTFEDVLNRLKARHMKFTLQQMRHELAEAEARGEDVDELRVRLKNLTRRERELKRPGSTA